MFFNHVVDDLKKGTLRSKGMWISTLFLAFFQALRIGTTLSFQGYKNSFGDYFFTSFMGSIYAPLGEDSFRFPITWFILMALPCALTLTYPLGELKHFGQHTLVRTNSRKRWFYSKALWCSLNTLVYFVLFLAFLFFFSKVIFHTDFTLSLNPQAQKYMNQLDIADPNCLYAVLGWIFFLPIYCGITLSTLQLTLSLFYSEVIALLVSMGILILSVSFETEFLVGNGGMFLRWNALGFGSIHLLKSVVILTVINGLCIFFGKKRFDRYDIL